MLRISLLVLLLLSFLLPVSVFAQQPEDFSATALTVDLWPEFDRPSMLVMFQFTLSSQVKLPAEIRFRIPAAAGAPNAVAVCEPGVNCYNTPYTQQPAGEWTELVIQATLPDVRVEYYDPGLEFDGSDRHFEFDWPGVFAVDSFKLNVQQPVGARQMRIKPGTVSQAAGDDGMLYFTLDAGPVPAGQTVEIDVDYVKDSADLSNTSLPVEPGEPLGSESSGRFLLSSNLPFVLGGVGILLMVGGGMWYWLSGRRGAVPEPRRRSRRRSSQSKPGEPAGDYAYCHQCGNRAAPGDRFCRVCGTTLRSSR